jgi:hypothetical protein
MLSSKDFRRIALGMEGATESAHMGHPDFRVNNRIFSTLHHDEQYGMVKLTPDEQRAFVRAQPSAFAPESGAWGLQGCTRVRIDAVDEDTLGEVMTLAWRAASAKPASRPSRSKAGATAGTMKPAAPRRSKTARPVSRTFADLVASYPREVQDLARATRALMLELLPQVEETVDPRGPYVSYGYGPGYKGVVSYITINRKGVKLGVAGGSSLPDPRKLLQGAGRSHRHIVIKTPADLRTPGLGPLVRAALAAWKKDRA